MNIQTDPEEAEGKDLVRLGFREGYKHHPAHLIALAAGLTFLVIIIMAAVWFLFTQAEPGKEGSIVSACGICGTYEHCDEETGKCVIDEGRCYNNDDCKYNELCEVKIHKCIPVF